MTEAELIFADGEFSYLRGDSLEDNAFDKQRNSDHYDLWRSGWMNAYEEQHGEAYVDLPAELTWYSIEDRLPDPDVQVLIRTHDGRFETPHMNMEGFWVLGNEFIGYEDGSLTFKYWSNLGG